MSSSAGRCMKSGTDGMWFGELKRAFLDQKLMSSIQAAVRSGRGKTKRPAVDLTLSALSQMSRIS